MDKDNPIFGRLIPISLDQAKNFLQRGDDAYIIPSMLDKPQPCRVRVEQDDQGFFDPRSDYEHLGTMITFDYDGLEIGDRTYNFEALCAEYEFVKKKENVYMKPLWIYNHSGYSLHFDRVDQWDSGQIGFIYASKKDTFDYFGERATDDNWQQLAQEAFDDEIRLMNLWLIGEIYQYRLDLRHVVECNRDDGKRWWVENFEDFESCGGYYGWDIEKSGLIDDILSFAKDKQFYALEAPSIVEEKEDGTYDE